MTTLYQLVYCSSNAMAESKGDVDQEIQSILDKARRNNTRDGITGALVFSAGSFAQVLEGPLAAIERTFERIQCDTRHGDVIVLTMQPTARRDFADWSMAYAGTLADAQAALALTRTCHSAGQEGADEVLELLRGLVHREEDWAAVARPVLSHFVWRAGRGGRRGWAGPRGRVSGGDR